MSETVSERHNRVVRELTRKILFEAETDAERLVILESTVLGVLLLNRCDVREASEYLDVLTARVIERLGE